MSRTRTTRVTVALASAGLLAALLAGCAAGAPESGSSDPQSVSDQSAAQDGSAQEQSQSAPGSAVEDRALVTTGTMGITTTDIAGVAQSATDLVAGYDGRVDSRYENAADDVSTTLTVRVPAEDYDALIESLRPLGEVQYLSTSVEDVTLEQADLDARIESLRASISSLRTILAQSTNVDDLLEVERELATREAELQSLESQQTLLDDQIAMSTLELTISNDELTNPTDEPEGFVAGLQAGWNALVFAVQGLLTILGFLLPGLVVLGIVAAIVWLVVRALVKRSRARRGAQGPVPQAAGPDASPAFAAAGPPQQPAHAGGTPPTAHPAPRSPADAPEGPTADRAPSTPTAPDPDAPDGTPPANR